MNSLYDIDEETKLSIGESVAALSTEAEHYVQIRKTDELMFNYYYDLSRHAIRYPEERKDEFEVMKFRQSVLIKALGKKFGIIHREGSAASGIDALLSLDNREFKEWYKEMSKDYKREQYESSICSACAFCSGAWEESEHIPCGCFTGTAISLRHPWACIAIDGKYCRMERHNFFDMIRARGGEEAVVMFERKELKIKRLFARRILKIGKRSVMENDDGLAYPDGEAYFLVKDSFEEVDKFSDSIGESSPHIIIGPGDIVALADKNINL